VATPESAAVEELLALRQTLDGRLDAVLANAVVAARFSAADALALRGAQARAQLDAPAHEALAAAIAEETLARAQRAQLARLPSPLVLPLISPQIARGELETLADVLEAVA
jgi:hypothetical protein